MSVIFVHNVTCSVGTFSLNIDNLELQQGSSVSVIGPSGAGKTLLLELLAGLRTVKSGTISGAIRGKSGLIFQDYLLFPHLSVADNIAFGPKARGASPSEQKRIVRDMADNLSLSHLLSRAPDTLSGGEKQRVALARAMAVNPDILLFDEPTTALDVLLKQQFYALIPRIRQQYNTTIVLVTHSKDEAELLTDTTIVMENGAIMWNGATEQLKQECPSPFVAAFFGLTPEE